MQEKFSVPKTKEEFIERANAITPIGAKSVISGLENQLNKKVGPIKTEIEFFKEVIKYREEGTVPERYENVQERA